MAPPSPGPLNPAEQRARRSRAARIARRLGFVGAVEYRHLYSQTGGAQYGRGNTAEEDLLTVYAEAFERDADPDDFDLEAIMAHECGHQQLIRNPHLWKVMVKLSGERFEEILASLVGSLLLGESESAQMLVWKAAAELGQLNLTAANTVDYIERLRQLLRHFL